MAKIIQLDDRLSNMIAAGEVVTRPASALKELLENAIDAQATSIDIQLRNHGLDEIKVIDNGIGMDSTDIHMAFLRHATSKIKNEYDLSHIKSLGFRGEAIPAIASVSKMSISSKMADSSPYEVCYEGGKLSFEGKTAMNDGTIVSVKELFYNVPARLKYIKSPQTELAYMIEVVDEMMLSHPKIAFRVSHDEKILRQTFGDNDYQNIFQAIYGKDVASELIMHQTDMDDIKISVVLVKPTTTRAKKNDIIVLVNKRTIKNYLLINSVIEGYHTHLMVGRYPIALIDIELDYSLIDVNVHPQKREIKFSNEFKIASRIRETIQKAFKHKPQTIPDVLKQESYKKVSGFELLFETIEQNQDIKDTFIIEEKPNLNSNKLPDLSYIGAYAGTYLLCQNELGLYLIDQHAAAERIRYEAIYKRIGEAKQISKPLITPFKYQLKPQEAQKVTEYISLLNTYGLEIESFGDYTFLIRALPVWLEEKDLDFYLFGIIEQLTNHAHIDLSKLRDQVAKDVACKGAIKANKPLSIEEVHHLIKGLQNCDNPYYCPHGRPVIIKFSQYEVEKLFKRIV